MRHTNRHARAPHRATGWGSSAAVLSAALLVVGLAGPTAPAEAAPEDPASSTEQASQDQAAAEDQHDRVGERTATDEPVLSVLTVEAADTEGTPVPGVSFDLWQESNDSAGLQPSADTDTDFACTTTADGTCTAGEDGSGAPQLGAGTYYWVQSQTPDGFQAPATDDEPVGTVTITEAEAGTDLDPTEVTLVATEGSGDEANEGAAADTGTGTRGSDEAQGDRATSGHSDRSAQAAEQEAVSADANSPRGESERPGAASAPLLAPDLLPRAAALGSVGIGDIQARLWGQSSNEGSWFENDCLTYAPQGPGASTTWVGNPGEAQAGHGGTGWTCSFDQSTQSVLGVTPSVATSVDPGQSFLLGQTTHYNNPIQAVGDRFSGSLSLRMSNVSGVEFTVPWEIWETANAPRNNRCADGGTNYSGINRNGCADRITFTSQVADQTVEIDGVTYTLVFDGFSPASGTCPATRPNDTQNVFWTMESDTTSACVYGTLVQVRNLTIVKELTTPDATAPSFTFASTSTLDGADWDGRSFSLDPNGTDSRSAEVTQGEGVSVTETAIPDGWSLDDVTCDGLTASDYSVADDTLTIASVPGAAAGATDIVCTFTNTTPQATLTVQKTWVDGFEGDGADLSIDGAVVATSSATGATGEWSDVENQGSALVTPGDEVAVGELLSEQNAGIYDSSLTCDSGVRPTDDGTFTMPVEDVTCTFTNTRLAPGLQVVKHGWASASHETEIASGSPVSSGTTVYWTYLVTNTGETALDHITVTDDQVGTATCPTTTLAPGQHMTCTASGPVTALP